MSNDKAYEHYLHQRAREVYQLQLLEAAQERLRDRLRNALSPYYKLQALAQPLPIRDALALRAGSEKLERRYQAKQSAVREGSGVAADNFLLPQNWNVDYEFEGRFETRADHPDGKVWVRKRRGRRVSNPFAVLLTSGSLTKVQAVAGDRMIALYASSKGLSGASDDTFDPSRPPKETPDPHAAAMHRAHDGNRYTDILTRIGNPRYKKLIRAVVHDVVCGDGAGGIVGVKIKKGKVTKAELIKDGVRWRMVIENAIGVSGDKAQAAAMRRACDFLVVAVDQHDRRYEWELFRKRRANVA